MNVTIFPTGKGGVESAVNYLLGDVDHSDKKRIIAPELIQGDPDTFTTIANATNRLHKYTSGVIALRDNESLSFEQINAVIEAFRSTFLPGLKPDENFADFWVAHREKGNLELHFLVANTELSTGRQLNIHPPGQQNIDLFNAFSAVMNDNLGFAQVVPDPLKISLKPFEAKSQNGKKDKKAKGDLAQVLKAEILDGSITNRNQLIGKLIRSGIEVPKVGKDFITVRLPGHQKNTRLKGPLFAKDSDYQELVKLHHQSKTPKFLTPIEAQEQRDKLAAGIEARRQFNLQRYLTARANRSKTALVSPSIPHREPRAAQLPEPVKTTLNKHLKEIRECGPVKRQASDLPHHTARRQDEHEREGQLSTVLGSSSLGGLEAQIGNLSLQYHSLLLLLVNAKGRRALQLKSQIMEVEQKLSALNLELEKKKAQTLEIKPQNA